MQTPATFHQHPYIWGGAAAVVGVYVVLKMVKGGASSASGGGTAVVSSAIDPTQAALTAQQMQDNVALTTASLQAQTQQAGLTALSTITASNNAASVQIAGMNDNAVNAQTAASIYATAVNGLTANSTAGTVSSAVPSGGVIGYGNEWLNADQATAAGFVAHSGQNVPVYTQNVSQGPATNSTQNQIEELFNNVIRAGQGTAPMQTVTMQPSDTTSYSQTGTAHIDPVFAVWDGSSAVPTITDVTLNSDSQYGYTGSVYTPGSAAAVNITPNAVPSATTASLPSIAQYG